MKPSKEHVIPYFIALVFGATVIALGGMEVIVSLIFAMVFTILVGVENETHGT